MKEHRGIVEKLNVALKDLEEHNSTLFQSNGLALKQGEKFVHSLNVKQIKCKEAKLTKVTQDMGSLENKKRSYDRAYIKQHVTDNRRRKKESQMKERGSRLKTTFNEFNEFMESTLETR